MDPEVNLPSTSRDTLLPQETHDKKVDSATVASTSSTSTIEAVMNRKAEPVEEKLKKLVQKLRNEKDSYTIRLKKASKLFKTRTFQEYLRKFSRRAAMFTNVMQFRQIPEDNIGCRFSKKEKIMALSLYNKGLMAYKWLSKVFLLPSPVTLNKLIRKALIKPGVNKTLFLQLKKKAQKMTKKGKLCMLLFDEIAISSRLDNMQRKALTLGNDKNKKVDHALVFMLRGIIKNYKQPIMYTFCSGSTPQEELTFLIKTVIRELQKCGLKVLATVCDHRRGNVSAISSLIKETKEKYIKNNENFMHQNTFEVNGQQIIPLFDPPHLIVAVRNNLIVKNLKYTIDNAVKIAKWDHIVRLYETNPSYRGERLIRNLTEKHVNPKKKSKMKVKYATQVFSRTFTAYMGYLAKNGILPEDCTDTAEILLFFDDMFDSMNGSYKDSRNKSEKPLLGPITYRSRHSQIWSKSKKILQSVKFITKEGKEGSVPSITNWIHTLENLELLKNRLFNLKVKWFYMRRFNLDPLEDFFGCLRSHRSGTISPTPSDFESAFTSLLINNKSSKHSSMSNCEEDSCKILLSMDCLL